MHFEQNLAWYYVLLCWNVKRKSTSIKQPEPFHQPLSEISKQIVLNFGEFLFALVIYLTSLTKTSWFLEQTPVKKSFNKLITIKLTTGDCLLSYLCKKTRFSCIVYNTRLLLYQNNIFGRKSTCKRSLTIMVKGSDSSLN